MRFCLSDFFLLYLAQDVTHLGEQKRIPSLYKYRPRRQDSNLLPPLLPARELNPSDGNMTVGIKKRAFPLMQSVHLHDTQENRIIGLVLLRCMYTP